jgi:acid stress-induced BolA-like protein IbaG/YrbA
MREIIQQRLLAAAPMEFVHVGGDDYHVELKVVSDVFLNKSRMDRQRWVYAQLKDLITAGRLHALSMKTWTKEEWENERG